MLEAARPRRAREVPVLRDDRLLGRQPGDAGRSPHAPAVEGEAVRGEVVGRPVEHRLDGRAPAGDVESREAVHEVHAQVDAAGLARRLERRARAPGIVDPPEPREHRVVERLDAEAHARHARAAVGGDLLARDALGVALDRDLGVGGEVEAAPDAVEHGGEVLRLEQRRRPAAEEDRRQAHARRPRKLGEQIELAGERPEVAGEHAGVERRRVEAAEVAALRAERDVDVQPEGVRRGRVVRQNRTARVVRADGAGRHLSQATHGPIRPRGPRYNSQGM